MGLPERRDRIDDYFEALASQLREAARSEAESLREAARIVADALLADGLVFAFGSGHSRFIAAELTWRAGGLAPVVAIEDPSHGAAERVEGYAASFLETYDIGPRDAVFVVSHSGINPVPVEVAQHASTCGATVIAVTSRAHSERTPSRHGSGLKLFELADLVLDTHVPFGDAALPLGDAGWRVAATSTAVATALLNAVVAQSAQMLLDAGRQPPVLVSANVPGGDEHNRRLADALWPRLTHFPRRGSSSAA